jgi:hypothetical protein
LRGIVYYFNIDTKFEIYDKEFPENIWYRSTEFRPSVAYRPLSFDIKKVNIFLLIEQQPVNRERRIKFYEHFKTRWSNYNIEDVTKEYESFIPRILYYLDEQIYINAIFPVIHSKYEAILIVKHNNVLKYCLTREIFLDESVRIR